MFFSSDWNLFDVFDRFLHIFFLVCFLGFRFTDVLSLFCYGILCMDYFGFSRFFFDVDFTLVVFMIFFRNYFFLNRDFGRLCVNDWRIYWSIFSSFSATAAFDSCSFSSGAAFSLPSSMLSLFTFSGDCARSLLAFLR